jgi:type II secretory pathway component GspD/PulD (secretin)
VLNIAPPQINIKTRFTEISQNDNKALGFDWFLGNTILGGGRSAYSGGTQPSLNGAATGPFPGAAANPFTGAASTLINQAGTDGLITSGLRNSFGRDNSVTPILNSGWSCAPLNRRTALIC